MDSGEGWACYFRCIKCDRCCCFPVLDALYVEGVYIFSSLLACSPGWSVSPLFMLSTEPLDFTRLSFSDEPDNEQSGGTATTSGVQQHGH